MALPFLFLVPLAPGQGEFVPSPKYTQDNDLKYILVIRSPMGYKGAP
jgi:hypothetical protein